MSRNSILFERAKQSIPGGVNSPVRAFTAVGGVPCFIKRALGPYLWDTEGKRYIDYVGSWGAMITGHLDGPTLAAVQAGLAFGFSFGAPAEGEIEIAEEICALVPSIEQVRLVCSGTEAAMSALRLARAFTGRARIIKFEGGYHGHADSLLVKAGSGLLTGGQASSAGVPDEIAHATTVLEYNNLEQIGETFAQLGDQIAAVIVEPIAGNMNLVRGAAEFLRALRTQCTEYGAVLIFDEVISGFRVALGGAQSLYGIRPDLTCLGKIIGGGFPLAAFGGRRDIMAHLAPLGSVYQAGTLSGNPVAVTAGLNTLKRIQTPGFYEKLSAQTERLISGIVQAARDADIVFSADGLGGLFGLYFAPAPPACLGEVAGCDMARFKAFFHAMLDHGIYLAPSPYEAGFVSSAHNHTVIDSTIATARAAFATLSRNS